MKTFIAAIGTALVLAGSASAMVTAGDHLPFQPDGQISASNHGMPVERSVDNLGNSPAGDFSENGSITVSVFETNDAGRDGYQGGAR